MNPIDRAKARKKVARKRKIRLLKLRIQFKCGDAVFVEARGFRGRRIIGLKDAWVDANEIVAITIVEEATGRMAARPASSMEIDVRTLWDVDEIERVWLETGEWPEDLGRAVIKQLRTAVESLKASSGTLPTPFPIPEVLQDALRSLICDPDRVDAFSPPKAPEIDADYEDA